MTTTLPKSVKTQAFINGEFVPSLSGETFDSLSPATGQKITSVTSCNEQDVDLAVRAARESFESGVWSRIAPAARKEVLFSFAQKIQDNLEELALIESIDAGKPISECRNFDLPDVISTIRWYAEAADKVFGKVSPTGPDNLGLIVREPIGVVGAVLPWNFPAAMLAWKIGPALAAGNSVVVKPPELASLTTIRIAEIAFEAGLPAGVFNVVPGLGNVAGKALGMSHDVDIVTFTGSTAVGRQFLRYSADSNLKEVVLEMGGKSPQIVTASWSHDLKMVAEDLAGAAFWNSGQNCSAGSRVLVHKSIKKELVAALAEAANSRVVGEPTAESTELGPLIEQKAFTRVLGYIEEARKAGATISSGGDALLAETGGWYVAPTVISDVTPEMAVANEEIFGPVVCVLEFDTDEEAIELANSTNYGLAATVWSRDVDQAIRLARGVKSGTVAVNGYSEGDITTPFGGYKESGFGGRDNGLEALDQYTELKTIWYTVR
ncbi:MAG: aldehyde dehydrogenase [Microbacteriaceae bacterium]